MHGCNRPSELDVSPAYIHILISTGELRLAGQPLAGKSVKAGQFSMLFDLTFPCYLTTFSGKKCLSEKVICAFSSFRRDDSCSIQIPAGGWHYENQAKDGCGS
jgi:hypothetical protein